MKKINSYVIKVLKNCLDFKNTKINMEFEDRVSLFIQTVSSTYFDFSKWGERRTFENLFHMIFTFDMNDVLRSCPEKKEEFRIGDFEPDDVIIAFLGPLMENQPLNDEMISELFENENESFVTYSFLIAMYVSIPFHVIERLLDEVSIPDKEIIMKSQYFTEEEYNSISFHCTSLGSYTTYLENYIARITTSVSLERNLGGK